MPWIFGIAEDEQTHRVRLEEMILAWARKTSTDVKLHSFPDATKLLGAWRDAAFFDAIFLDIELPGGPSGIEFAETVRLRDREIPIIFVTNHRDFMGKGFYLEALDFIIKPIEEAALATTLNRLAYRLEQRVEHFLTYRLDRETMRYPIREIRYFTSMGHYILINNDEEFRFREPVDQLLARLPKNFVRIHRSIIVNMDHVYQYSVTRVIIDDKQRTEHPVGRNYSPSFLTTINEYRRFF